MPIRRLTEKLSNLTGSNNALPNDFNVFIDQADQIFEDVTTFADFETRFEQAKQHIVKKVKRPELELGEMENEAEARTHQMNQIYRALYSAAAKSLRSMANTMSEQEKSDAKNWIAAKMVKAALAGQMLGTEVQSLIVGFDITNYDQSKLEDALKKQRETEEVSDTREKVQQTTQEEAKKQQVAEGPPDVGGVFSINAKNWWEEEASNITDNASLSNSLKATKLKKLVNNLISTDYEKTQHYQAAEQFLLDALEVFEERAESETTEPVTQPQETETKERSREELFPMLYGETPANMQSIEKPWLSVKKTILAAKTAEKLEEQHRRFQKMIKSSKTLPDNPTLRRNFAFNLTQITKERAAELGVAISLEKRIKGKKTEQLSPLEIKVRNQLKKLKPEERKQVQVLVNDLGKVAQSIDKTDLHQMIANALGNDAVALHHRLRQGDAFGQFLESVIENPETLQIAKKLLENQNK